MPSVTRKPSGASERREVVERRVLDAVERLLDDGHAFTELSVQTIADAAGIARSTFYVHFADKTELLVKLSDAVTAGIFEEGARWLTSDHTGGPPRLATSIEGILAAYRGHASVLAAVMAATGYDPVVAEFWRSRIESFVAAGAARFEADIARGVVNVAVDPEPLARIVAWSIERNVGQHVQTHAPSDDPAFAASLARALWLMIYGDAPA